MGERTWTARSGRTLVLPLLVALVAGALVTAFATPLDTREPTTDGLRGVNVATLVSQAVTIYDHPEVTDTGEPQSTYDLLAGRGHELIRLPVDWNYLQPKLGSGDRAFHPAYWKAVQSEVGKIKRAGLRAVLDLHNGCEWSGPKNSGPPLVCGVGLPIDTVADTWRRLSDAFRGDPAVIAYDLFNEPTKFNHPTLAEAHDPARAPYAKYQEAVNAAVAAIRNNHDRKTIWVEALCCSSYLDFASTDPNGGWVQDPADRIVYSQHMYPVGNSAVGESFNPAKLDRRYDEPAGTLWADHGYTRGFLDRLETFGSWCSRSGLACSIGEVGWYGRDQSADSARQWNDLGDKWYQIANKYRMSVTYYGTSSAYQTGLWAYDSPVPNPWFPAPGVTRDQPQAAVIEKPENLSMR